MQQEKTFAWITVMELNHRQPECCSDALPTELTVSTKDALLLKFRPFWGSECSTPPVCSDASY